MQPYIIEENPIPINSDLREIQDASSLNRGLVSILGDFWVNYFTETPSLQIVASATVASISEQYTQLLSQVLSSSIVDVPVNVKHNYELLSFVDRDCTYVYDEIGELEYLSFNCKGLQDISFLSDRVVEPTVLLENKKHYELVGDELRFYVDIFLDPIIQRNTYTYKDSNKVLLFWATDYCFKETYIYDRFGVFLYHKEYNSEIYKHILTGLQYFYTNSKSARHIENVIDFLFGLPYSRDPGEVVTSVGHTDPDGVFFEGVVDFNLNTLADSEEDLLYAGYQHKIFTDKNTYYAPMYTTLRVAVGDTLKPFQPLCVLNRVQDYINTPDWYDDVPFPFELVEDIRHFSEEEVTESFTDYLPAIFGENHVYDGSRYYTGLFKSVNEVNPFANTRCKKNGTAFETALYQLMDQVLKYNLLHIHTSLNYDNFRYFKENKIMDTLDLIRTGIPVYLHIVHELIFDMEVADKLDLQEETLVLKAEIGAKDYQSFCTGMVYDGTWRYNNGLLLFYNGDYGYDGKAELSGVKSTEGKLLSNRGLLGGIKVKLNGAFCHISGVSIHDLEMTCEPEYFELNADLITEDNYKLFNFYPEKTFPLPHVQSLYDGLLTYSGKYGFTHREQSHDFLNLKAELKGLEDTLVISETLDVAVDLEMKDLAGNHDGTISLDNVIPLVYGDLEPVQSAYDGGKVYDGVNTYNMVDPSVLMDGSYVYNGRKEVGYTYGGTVPKIINMHDSLELTFRRRVI